MDRYIGLFIGIDKYRDSRFPNVGHAVDDAVSIRQAFIDAGCHEDRMTLLVDGDCTHSTVQTAIKRLSKLAMEGDVVIMFFAGHGLSHGGENFLLCHDTDHGFISSTAVTQRFISDQLKQCASTQKMVFMDACHSGVAIRQIARDGEAEFSITDLKYLARDVQYLAVFSSCMDDERSLTDYERRHGIWTYYLIQALTGRVPKLYEQGLLFSDKLQAYLKQETLQRSHELSTKKAVQTPQLQTAQNDRFIVADLSIVLERLAVEASGIEIPIAQSLLIRREDELITRLPGFNPMSHYSPRPGSAEGFKFIKKLATQLIESELVALRDRMRSGFGYTRKDMPNEVSVVDGTGTISTKDFDYTISVEHSSGDHSKYVLVHTIHNLRSLQLLADDKFNKVFDRIEELEIELERDLVVRDIIDALEEIDDPPFTLKYDELDFEYCEVIFRETGHSILISQSSVVFRPHLRTSSSKIVEGYSKSMGMLRGPAGMAMPGM